MTTRENVHELVVKKVTTDDVALYTAVAMNKLGSSSSSANLNVKSGKINKIDVNSSSGFIFVDGSRPTSPGGTTILPHAPYFTVKLKDTELLHGTTVRFELVVRGMPHPAVTL